MSPADAQAWTQTSAATVPSTTQVAVSQEELAAMIRRAAALGIQAWRVTTALGIPLPLAASR